MVHFSYALTQKSKCGTIFNSESIEYPGVLFHEQTERKSSFGVNKASFYRLPLGQGREKSGLILFEGLGNYPRVRIRIIL